MLNAPVPRRPFGGKLLLRRNDWCEAGGQFEVKKMIT